jgi:hypothetical protein
MVPLRFDDPASFQTLARDIADGTSVSMHRVGAWYEDQSVSFSKNWFLNLGIIRIFRKIFGTLQNEQCKAAKKFVESIVSMAPSFVVSKDKIIGIKQPEKWVEIEQAIDEVKNTMSCLQQKKEARQALILLEQARLSYHYLGVNQEEIDQRYFKKEDFDWLLEKCKNWEKFEKNGAVRFPSVNFTDSQAEDTKRKLEQACRYPEYIELLRNAEKDVPSLQDTFFKNILYNMSSSSRGVDIHIQTPSIRKKWHVSYTDKRLARFPSEKFRFIQEQNPTEESRPIKAVQLLVDGEFQNVSSSQNVVHVAEKVNDLGQKIFETMKVSEMYRTLKHTDKSVVNFECFERGFMKVDMSLKTFNIDKENWWEDLPVFLEVEEKDLESLYGKEWLKPEDKALIVLRASRQTPDLNAGDTHSWFNFWLRSKEDPKKFHLIPLGKYANQFPVTKLETLFYIFGTQKAGFTLADMGEFINTRDQCHLPLSSLSEEDLKKLMGVIKKELIFAREGKLSFQAQGDNCSTELMNILHQFFEDHEVLHDAFHMTAKDIKVPLILSWIPFFGKILPNDAFQAFRRTVSAWFGAKKRTSIGGREISLFDNKAWRKGDLYLPALLFQQKDSLLQRLREKPLVSRTIPREREDMFDVG